MATKYSPSTTFEEKQVILPQEAITGGMIAGGLITSDYGYGDEVIDLYTVEDLINTFGKPNNYNYKHWFNLHDYLLSGKQCKVVRAIPTNAHNSSIKLKGISKLKTNSWYASIKPRTLSNPSEDFYNTSVAEFTLDTFTSNYKLQFVNRYVTAEQNLVVAVCSNIDHYDQPIFNEEMEVIRDFDAGQAPALPKQFERYTILRNVAVVDETTTGTVIVNGDYTTILEDGDKLILNNTGNVDVVVTVDTTTPMTYVGGKTTITIDETISASGDDGTLKYLLGDWRTTEAFVDGDLVEYSGSAWSEVTVAIGKKYYVVLQGNVYQWSGTVWNAVLTDDYIPVDENGDSKAEYAVQNIFDRSLLNSDNSVKTFKQIFKDNVKFLNDEVLVFVFKINDLGKLEKVEDFIGSYDQTARDDNNNPYGIEKVVFDGSEYIYAKVGTANEYSVTSVTTNQYTNSSATSAAVAISKTFTFVAQDLSEFMEIGKQFTIAETTSNDDTFTIVSYDYGVTTALATTIVVSETVVDETFSESDETLDISENKIVVNTQDLQNFQIGEKLNYTDFTIDGTAGVDGQLTIAGISYAGGNTTITVVEDLLLYVVASTTIDDSLCGKVSTNMNKYGNPRDAAYDIANDNASEGFSVANMKVYDTDPKNSSSVTITDYSNLETSDLNSSAAVFDDKDNVGVDILISFETIDEYGNHHQDKIAEIANKRADCIAIVAPFDESLFIGNTGDAITENLVNEFGNNRDNIYQGTFTKYSKYTATFGFMKYVEDIYNNVFRYVPVVGDIARMLVLQDAGKGAWYPIAGIPDGELNNQIKLTFIATEDQRETLGMNAINFNYINPRLNNPILFSNKTTYRVDGLFQVLSYRMMLIKIERFIADNVFPLYFKFKDDIVKKKIRDAVNPFLQDIVARRGLRSGELIFPTIQNEPSDTMTLYINLVPTGILEHFNVVITMTEQGLTVEEA